MVFPSTKAASLDQLASFVAVADAGSFSAAARARKVAQPAISQSIRGLESLLACTLFDRSPYRPVLTSEGRLLLPFARRVVGEAVAFDEATRLLTSGDHRIAISMDHACPTDIVLAAIRALAAEFKALNPTLRTDTLDAVAKRVLDGSCELGLASSFTAVPDSLNRMVIGYATFMLLVSREHPLASRPLVTHAELRSHDQLIMAGHAGGSGSRDFGVFGRKIWHLGNVALLRAALLAGDGYAIVPEHLFAADLTRGMLVPLTPDPMLPGWERPAPYFLIWRGDTPLSPVARRLVDIMGG